MQHNEKIHRFLVYCVFGAQSGSPLIVTMRKLDMWDFFVKVASLICSTLELTHLQV